MNALAFCFSAFPLIIQSRARPSMCSEVPVLPEHDRVMPNAVEPYVAVSSAFSFFGPLRATGSHSWAP